MEKNVKLHQKNRMIRLILSSLRIKSYETALKSEGKLNRIGQDRQEVTGPKCSLKSTLYPMFIEENNVRAGVGKVCFIRLRLSLNLTTLRR